jgi:hypothetical protein
MYEAANVMLTRYKAQLKDWAFAIARRSRMHLEAAAALCFINWSSDRAT